jgi:drug/metabolite transporter (DMT)-like permease
MVRVYTLLTLCVLFWSGNFIVGRYIKDDIEPLELAFFRWLFVLVMVFPFLIIHHKNIFQSLKNNSFTLIGLSLLAVTLFNTILYIGLSGTGANNALLINLNVPIVILILSFLILKQNIQINQIVGIIFSTIGVVYIVLKGDIKNLFTLQFQSGDLWIMLAATTWALYSVLVKFRPKDLSDFEFFSTIVFVGFLFLSPWYLTQGYSIQNQIDLVVNNFWVFFYVSFFTSILSYFFWHYGIEKIGASKTSQFTYLMPLFGSVMAYLFLDESLQLYHLFGAFGIGAGIYLSLFYEKRKI